jgi:maltose/moltooligosaccharide transporter
MLHKKAQLTNNQMFNMNFGYLGIQLAWALQFANISGVFKFLGADDSQIPILWLAGPITGLIIPPIIGYISDYTWVKYLGRRRFYILIGTLLAAVALILIPNTKNLITVVMLVWLLDSGLNMAMHPYRALIADKTPVNQQTKCFAVLTILSCLGSALAFITPWVLAFFYQYEYDTAKHSIPPTIETAFILGSIILLITNVWTVLITTEDKEDKLSANHKDTNKDINNLVRLGTLALIRKSFYMPKVMKDLIIVELFTWIGIFSFIVYYALGISQNIFGLPDGANIANNFEYSLLLQKGVELCGLHSCFYILISSGFALFLARLSSYIERKNIYSCCLFLGGVGLIMTRFSSTNEHLIFCVLLIGLAWGAIVTLPFAILSSGVPKDKVGWYMGYYNLFVVIPQIIVSCCFGFILRVVFHNNAMSIISFGGIFMLFASYFAYKITDPYTVVIQKMVAEPRH